MPRHPFTAILCLALTACADHAAVRVRAFYESGIPLTDLEVTLLPFDAHGLLDSLGRSAPSPPPDVSRIEARIRDYRRTEATPADVDAATTTAWLAIRDSVARMARELSRQDRKGGGYREAYARFRQLYARYAARQAERDAKVRGLFAQDRALAGEATRASDSLRSWEALAYREFPLLAEARAAATGREVSLVRTDSSGTAVVELRNGAWWALARLPDPDNPFLEFSWSVPVTVTAGLPLSLPLMRANAVPRWRH